MMMTTAMEFVAGDGVRGIEWNGATMAAAVDSSRYVRPCCFFLPLLPPFVFLLIRFLETLFGFLPTGMRDLGVESWV